jgi:isocitrate/isopropylmalate dehydrogenase
VTTTDSTTTAQDHVPRAARSRAYVVACLAGHGIGPEVTAAASRALAELARHHGFRVDEIHPPFDTEAVARSGHPLPAATRHAIRGADAVLVAGGDAPALEGVRVELDLAVAVTRAVGEGGATTVFWPLHEGADDAAIDRAFAAARAHAGRLACVSVSPGWRERVERHVERHAGVQVDHLSLVEALRLVVAGAAGVILAEGVLGEALAEAPRLGGPCLLARGELGADGPGLFGPSHGTDHADAGHGVVDPSEMLLAASLLLAEGLGRRAAGEALEESLGVALAHPQRADGGSGVMVTTREFVDAVLGLLPSSRRDTEFALGVRR